MFARICLCAVLYFAVPLTASAQVMRAAPAPETPRLFSSQGVKYADGFTGEYRQVYELIARRYVDRQVVKQLKPYDGPIADAAERDRRIKELVEQLNDRWTKFRSADDLADAQDRFDVGAVSPGFALDRSEAGWVVSYLWCRGAAEKSGLRRGDRIVSVNGAELSAAMSQSELEWTICGSVGEEVEVRYFSPGAKQKSTTKLTYLAYDPTVVSAKLLDGNVLYVQVTTFSNFNLLNDFARAMAAVMRQAKGQVTGIVLDLRGNTGGYMDLAFEFAGAFVRSGPISRTTSRDGRVLHDTTHIAQPYLPELLNLSQANLKLVEALYDAPMVVLVNSSTMSAAEMLTSALKDSGRATILGEQTWGKAVSFISVPVCAGQLQLVTGTFAGPSGYNHNLKGIAPHEVLVQPRQANGDPQLERALVLLKSKKVASVPGDVNDARKDSNAVLVFLGSMSIFLLAVVIGLIASKVKSRKSSAVREPDFSWAETADETGAVPPGSVDLTLPDGEPAPMATVVLDSSIVAPDSYYIGVRCPICYRRFAAGDDIIHRACNSGCFTYCADCIGRV